jgi:16S rRNA (guanine(966)-N(2))-methyltransferase RsmD
MMQGKRVEGKPVDAGRQRRDAQSTRAGAGSVSKGSQPSAQFAGAPAQVRIIGGRWKRTLLPVTKAPGLRPSPDRVRETAFNWIAHFIADFAGVRGLDLFAGTGALGFELASRGAADVILVERNAAAARQLERIRHKLAADSVHIVVGDALAFVRSAAERSFDVVFLDPPFEADLLGPAIEAAARLVTAHGLVYVESGAPLPAETASRCGLQLVRESRAGQVHFHLLQKA